MSTKLLECMYSNSILLRTTILLCEPSAASTKKRPGRWLQKCKNTSKIYCVSTATDFIPLAYWLLRRSINLLLGTSVSKETLNRQKKYMT